MQIGGMDQPWCTYLCLCVPACTGERDAMFEQHKPLEYSGSIHRPTTGVAEAAVTVQQTANGQKRLVASITLSNDGLDVRALKAHAR